VNTAALAAAAALESQRESMLPFLLRDPWHADSVLRLATHLCRGNLALSNQMLDVGVRALVQELAGDADFRPAFRLVFHLLTLPDTPVLSQQRVAYAIPLLVSLAKKVATRKASLHDDRFLMLVSKYLLMLAFRSVAASDWLRKHADDWTHLLESYKSNRQ